MKLKQLVPPLLAVGISAAIVGPQKGSLHDLEAESTELSKRIDAAKSRSRQSSGDPAPERSNHPAKNLGPINWKSVAEGLGQMLQTGGVMDMRQLMAFQRQLEDLDLNELFASLDEITALELDEAQRGMLENVVIEQIIKKDAEAALEKFKDRIGEDKSSIGWQLASALGQWAENDAAAATAWFDAEIASGSFDSKSLDGKSDIRTAFESSLITQLLKSDPGAAEQRVLALPENQREDVFGSYGFIQMKFNEQTAYADLARKTLSDEKVTEVFANQASRLAMTGDFKKVDEFMDRISVTPEQRIRSAEEAAMASVRGGGFQSKITAEKVDSMRDWLGNQSPGSVARVTGAALGNAVNRNQTMGFSEAAGLVLRYHEEGGGDEVLSSFLSGGRFGENSGEAREIAGKISDSELRLKVLEGIK